MKSTPLFILILFSAVAFSQVGIGTTTPNASAALDITSTTTGVLVPRMTEAQRTAISSPATGLLVYQIDNTAGFWFFDGSVWANLSTGGNGEFQSVSGMVQNTTNVGSDDFVFGDTDLTGSGSKFYFDKSKGAFRAGEAFGTEWDDVNVGSGSIALGVFSTASGLNAIAMQGGVAAGENSLSIGNNTQTNANNAFALGNGSTIDTGADNAISIGNGNYVSNQDGTAIGYENIASGVRSFAFGSTATASGSDAVAFSEGTASGGSSFAGIFATASGQNAIALQGGVASELNSLSIGPNTEANGENSYAIGNGSVVDTGAFNGLALGKGNSVTNQDGTAIGYENIASGVRSFAFGSTATASGSDAVAFSEGTASGGSSFAGIFATASGQNAIALQGGVASELNSLSIGPNTEANGENSYAIGNGSVVDTGADNGLALGKGNQVTNNDGTAIGYENIASGVRSFAFGSTATASGSDAVAFSEGTASGGSSLAGILATASGQNSIALQGGVASELNSLSIGPNTEANGENSYAIGNGSVVDTGADNGLALGKGNQVTNNDGTAIGYENIASGVRSFAFGSTATASGSDAVAFSEGTASGANSFAGINATASGQNAIALQGGVASGENTISIGNDTAANGNKAIAIGDNVIAYSFHETVLGYGSASYTPSSTTTNIGTDRLLVVANSSTNNALNILKNGRMGISRIPTTNILEVEGDASKTTAGSWLGNSDRRLKTNIETISEENALEKILLLRGVTYQWSDDVTGYHRPDGIQYGFIAQELMEVFPEKVSMDNQGFYQTAYGDYDPVFVQSIKALNTKIEKLETDNELLKQELRNIYSLLKNMELDERKFSSELLDKE
ncbi:tail fiber domain-containing protein [Altibacter lentus]|uniref:tail fiber domain-containing protein n=1 Tax=Altibacter lentus TaxID=1223410 RepID=UPI000553B454|nr:tail fiber domain-containing protein [Altibacter lentus]